MEIDWKTQIPKIIEFYEQDFTNREIANYYGITEGAWRSVQYRLRQQGLLPQRDELATQEYPDPPQDSPQTIQISFPDMKQPKKDWREFLNAAIKLQEEKQKKKDSQSEATVKIQTDRPFAVSFSSDWHLGGAGVNYQALLSHFDLYLSVPNLLFGVLGDYGDFFVKSKIKQGMLNALFGPQDQADVLEGIFYELGGKMLFRTLGNHDEFPAEEVGIDVVGKFLEGAKCPYLREGGGITLRVNDDIQYRIYVKHKYRYHSSLNLTNSLKRMHDIESPFDVGVVGHRHTPSLEHTDKYSGVASKDVIYILTGTYKQTDAWARQQGFGAQAKVGVPTVVFFPDERKMVPFKYVEDAVTFLQAFN